MKHYYNENNGEAAEWLRELMRERVIPYGEIDTRSIEEVSADDLRGFTHCHWFAGIGGWAAAAIIADWFEPMWSGSCPCQPFSAAGKRRGIEDERHLWPVWHRLIAQRRPPVVFGEQVASADGRKWFAGVRSDLEALGYAVGGADYCAAGVGAPHIRQRLWWVAYAAGSAGFARIARSGQRALPRPDAPDHDGLADTIGDGWQQGWTECAEQPWRSEIIGSGALGPMADAQSGEMGVSGQPWEQRNAIIGMGDTARQRFDGRQDTAGTPGGSGLEDNGRMGNAVIGMADAERDGSQGRLSGRQDTQREIERGSPRCGGATGFWDGFDVIPCADGKARRIESGTFPLANGVSGRVGLLRGYGNAISPIVAARFMQATRLPDLERFTLSDLL